MLVPIRFSLTGAVIVSLLAPVLHPAPWLVALLIKGPAVLRHPLRPGDRATQARALTAFGFSNRRLCAFRLSNLFSASAAGGPGRRDDGVVAQATTDFVPYAFLAEVAPSDDSFPDRQGPLALRSAAPGRPRS